MAANKNLIKDPKYFVKQGVSSEKMEFLLMSEIKLNNFSFMGNTTSECFSKKVQSCWDKTQQLRTQHLSL